jgi:hypothetical protein
MGSLISSSINSTKLTAEFNGCKQSCWNGIKDELKNGFLNERPKIKSGNMLVDNEKSYEFQLRNKGQSILIGCPTCLVKCNNCMYIIVRFINNRYDVDVYSDEKKTKDLGGKGNLVTTKQVYDYIEEVYRQYK